MNFTDKTILLGINHLSKLGGSETFTYTLAKEFVRRDFKVDVFTFKRGYVSKKIEELSERCNLINLAQLKLNKYDIAVVSHNSVLGLPFNAKKSIQICHGIYPTIEQPSYLADYHVAISQEVSDHLICLGFINTVLSNPIDLDRFNVKRPIGNKLSSILSLCQGDSANNLLEKVCYQKKIPFTAFSKFSKSRWDIENAINEADLVVSLGRGVMESMACGRSVLVFDHRAYSEPFSDGVIQHGNIEAIKEYNFSGRRYKYSPTAEFLEKELQKYNRSQGKINHDYAIDNFSVKHYVNDILSIFSSLDVDPTYKQNKINVFSKYQNKFVRFKNKTYFLNNNLKCLIDSNERKLEFMETLSSIEPTVLTLPEDLNLDMMPTVSIGNIVQNNNRLRLFNLS